MKVLLTGSAGFIGTAIGRQLEAAGVELVRVDLMLPNAHGSADAPPGTHQLDVREAATSTTWAELLAGVDVVCHQAAIVGAGVKVADLPEYAGHNDLGTAALMAAMHEAGVTRLVQASSMVVYGEGRYVCSEHGDQAPPARPVAALESGDFDNHCPVCDRVLDWALVPESARLDPRSSYAASKLAQEHYATAWARQADAAAVSLRYHNVYGPGMPRDTPYSGVAAMFRSSLERGEPPTVFEDGGQMRDFVHVDDVARANVLSIQHVAELDVGETRAYNVCSGQPISILEVAETLARSVPPDTSVEPHTSVEPVETTRAARITGGFRPGDVRHIVASPELATRELGFTAEIGPSDGIADFATAPLRA